MSARPYLSVAIIASLLFLAALYGIHGDWNASTTAIIGASGWFWLFLEIIKRPSRKEGGSGSRPRRPIYVEHENE